MRHPFTSDNVIPLVPNRGHTELPEGGDPLERMLAYWQGKCRAGDVPRRADIDPRGITDLLEHAMILEKIAPGLARMRIAGQHLNDLMGMEVRGMPVSAFISPEHRECLSEALNDLFERPAILRAELTAPAGFGRPKLRAGLILMPLRSDLGDISRALGCLVSARATGRKPHRFDIAALRIDPLTAGPARPAPTLPEPKEKPALHLARSDTETRPHLRLVETD